MVKEIGGYSVDNTVANKFESLVIVCAEATVGKSSD
jgi:hypothetical protein